MWLEVLTVHMNAWLRVPERLAGFGTQRNTGYTGGSTGHYRNPRRPDYHYVGKDRLEEFCLEAP